MDALNIPIIVGFGSIICFIYFLITAGHERTVVALNHFYVRELVSEKTESISRCTQCDNK